MSNDVKTIEISSIDDLTLIEMSGVKIMDDLKSTLKTNFKRLDKNSGEYLTPTKIIFNYVRFVNLSLIGCKIKKEYLKTAEMLIEELDECGFYVGEEWRNKNLLPYSKGNKKLPKSTVIINIAPSSLCVSKNNGLCDVCGVCYALSTERRYINTLIYRLTQMIRFEEMSVDEIVNQLLRMRVFKTLRVNESGDIMSLNDVYKLRKIAKKLFDERGIHTYIYTHRVDLFDKIKPYQTPYFKINRSGVDFNSLKSIKPHHNHLFCDGDCNDCVFCKIELNIPIDSLLHGDYVGEDLRDDETVKRDLIIKHIAFKMFDDGEDEGVIESVVRYLLNPPLIVDEFDDDVDMDLIKDVVCVYMDEEDGWERIYPQISSSEFIWRHTMRGVI